MTYKKKASILAAVVAALALANIFTFVFVPGASRSNSFAWLDTTFLASADRIELYGRDAISAEGNNNGTPIVLSRKNNRWVFQGDKAELPVKQARVEDLFASISRKAVYPKRAVSVEARKALVLEEGRSSRIVIHGGAGLPLLDLMIGTADALSREVYLRKAGQNDIYSGEDLFTVYTESNPVYWYDLRLFPADDRAPTELLSVEAVQQAEISIFSEETAEKSQFTLQRERSGWVILHDENTAVDSQRADAWLRSVLEAEADDFGTETPELIDRSITLHFGNGKTSIIQAGQIDMENTGALVSDSDHGFVFSNRTASRLFREKLHFLKPET